MLKNFLNETLLSANKFKNIMHFSAIICSVHGDVSARILVAQKLTNFVEIWKERNCLLKSMVIIIFVNSNIDLWKNGYLLTDLSILFQVIQ